MTNKNRFPSMHDQAAEQTNNELLHHALVSIQNRDECGECFCCAAWLVMYERGDKRVPRPPFTKSVKASA